MSEDPAVIAAREWLTDALETGIAAAPTDLSTWVWLPRSTTLANGRELVELVSPSEVDRAFIGALEGKPDHEVVEHVTLEMEETDEGWRYCGQPTQRTEADSLCQ